jgi:hypothetical protein
VPPVGAVPYHDREWGGVVGPGSTSTDVEDEDEIAALRQPVVDCGPIYRADPRD